jgi:inward rectifier potassium channel
MTDDHPYRVFRKLRVALTRAIRTSTSSMVSLAGYPLTVTGLNRFDLRDSYHLVVALSWPRFLTLAISAYLAMNVFFAAFYLARSGAIANARPGSLLDAFFFSVETAATVGYGEMYPATLYGHIVCTAEIFTGVAFTALATGLLFVRFARPKARLAYATNAVVASHGGQPTLMIRIANGRYGMLYDAVAHLSIMLTDQDEQGNATRVVHELRLERSRLPMFFLWTLMHVMDETSPLHGYDADRLNADDAYLLLGIRAHDVTVAAQVLDTKGYAPSEIQFGMRYAELLSFDGDRQPVADLAAVSNLEPDVGPEPRRSRWEDRQWTEREEHAPSRDRVA